MEINYDEMMDTVEWLTLIPKGILDEDIDVMDDIFKLIDIENTSENRIKNRKLLFTTQNLENFVSGIIMSEETYSNLHIDTINNVLLDNQELPQLSEKIFIGIRVDTGFVDLPNGFGEQITRGLDELSNRCIKYYELGVKFSKWKCRFDINPENGWPSNRGINRNAIIIANFATISQDCGLVPIIELEINICGDVDDIRINEHMTREILSSVYRELIKCNVILDLTLLKLSVVKFSSKKEYIIDDLEDIAFRTLKVLQDTVPVSIPGIILSSEGLLEDEFKCILKIINGIHTTKPWKLLFSCEPLMQQSILKILADKDKNLVTTQEALLKNVHSSSLASVGRDNASTLLAV
jgi:fructose-bisphosphate aldolase class I